MGVEQEPQLDRAPGDQATDDWPDDLDPPEGIGAKAAEPSAASFAPEPSGTAEGPAEEEPELAFDGPPPEGAFSHGFRALALVRRRFSSDRCGAAAAALSFQTVLTLLPLLGLGLVALKATGRLGAGARLPSDLARALLPVTADARLEAAQSLSFLSTRFVAPALAAAAVLLAVVLGLALFLRVEALYGEIWGAGRRRTFFQRLLLFNAALTLLPFPLLVSLWHTASLSEGVSFLHLLLCLSVQALTLTLAGRAIPSAQVKWGAAVSGGLLSALFLEAIKLACAAYIGRAVLSGHALYGVLGLPLVALLALYLSWMAVLLGAELTHALQTLADLDPALRLREESEGEEVLLNEELVLRLLGDIAHHFAAGHKALPAGILWQRHGIPEKVAREILRRLSDRDLVIAMDDAYLPARPLERIRLDEVLQAFRAAGRPEEEPLSALGQLLREVRDGTRKQLGERTLADLVS